MTKRFAKRRKKQQQQQNHGGNRSDQEIFLENPDIAYITQDSQWIRARSKNQKTYIETIRNNNMIVGIGPAGTGKTFLPVAMALQALKVGEVSKIIITRPVVEAGERLGFLPGALEEKINPYLRPIYDAIESMEGFGAVERLVDNRAIEIAPIAYMRGRTFENSFIIVDEAQNTTVDQLEMLVTRMGMGSKLVITGDITQVDLPKRKNSGLLTFQKIVGNIDKIKFHSFTEEDVMRHPIVKEIVRAYEIWKNNDERK